MFSFVVAPIFVGTPLLLSMQVTFYPSLYQASYLSIYVYVSIYLSFYRVYVCIIGFLQTRIMSQPADGDIHKARTIDDHRIIINDELRPLILFPHALVVNTHKHQLLERHCISNGIRVTATRVARALCLVRFLKELVCSSWAS